jgi:hypothetical protein
MTLQFHPAFNKYMTIIKTGIGLTFSGRKNNRSGKIEGGGRGR